MTEIIRKKRSYKGWHVDDQGYLHVKQRNHPFCDCGGWVQAHRLVMEEYLERYLLPEEEVHHLDMNPSNNRIGNLMWFANQAEHKSYEKTGAFINNKKDKSDRKCNQCGSDITLKRKRKNRNCNIITIYDEWFNDKINGGFLCNNCYNRKAYRKRKKN